jgi:DNA primase
MSATTEVGAVVRQYLDKVKTTGSENLMAVCPFHRRTDGAPERTPSFAISIRTGLYFCHSCKEAGNFRQFLQRVGVTSYAIKTQYGVLLDEIARNAPAPRNPTRQYHATDAEPLPESLLGLFDYSPIDLIKEGFTEQTLAAFDVGFDEKHMRITFPLRNMKGELVGLSGRSVLEYERRFKVYDMEYASWGLSPRKTSMADVLWNIDHVYPQVYFGKEEPIVVVEGFKGCMWLHQAGIRNVVALCGSYLKEGQRWLLEHLGGVVYVMLDNDQAGKSGTLQVGKTLARSLKTRIITYRETAKQPTDLSHEEVHAAFDNAQEYFLWNIKRHQTL